MNFKNWTTDAEASNLLLYKKDFETAEDKTMWWSLLVIIFFAVGLIFPGTYIIMRKAFPRKSKRLAYWTAGIITVLLSVFFGLFTAGVI